MATLADLARFGWGNRGGLQPSQGGVMGQPGFRPSPRPMGAPVSGAQPWPSNSTTGGVGTTMQPNAMNTGGLQPNMASQGPTPGPAPTNGPRLPPIPPGTQPFFADNWAAANGYPWNANNPKPGSEEWFRSPQGLNAQKEMAMRIANGVLPGSMNGSNFTGAHQGGRDYRSNSGEGYQSPMSQMTRQQASAQSLANWANPDWRMRQVLAGRIAPTNNVELQAMIANMAPADRDAYLAKYRSIGLDPTYQGGGGTGPFGN